MQIHKNGNISSCKRPFPNLQRAPVNSYPLYYNGFIASSTVIDTLNGSQVIVNNQVGSISSERFSKEAHRSRRKKKNTEVLVNILSPSNVISGCEYCYFKYIHVETYFVHYFLFYSCALLLLLARLTM